MKKFYRGTGRLWSLCFCLIASLCLQDVRVNQTVFTEVSALQGLPTAVQPSPFPTTPPDASKIIVAEPDIEGYADIQGAAGAVPGLSTVAVINLDTNSIMTTTATVNGAFVVNLYAPVGSSLLVKYDVEGEALTAIWRHAQNWDFEGDFSIANPLPGTIIPVGSIPLGDGTRQEFQAVSRFADIDKSWAAFQLGGEVEVPSGNSPPGLAAMPGDPITMTMHLVATSPAVDCSTSITSTLYAAASLRYLFNPEGRAEPWGMWFTAHLFTPTGLPIEHEAGGEAPEIVSGQPFTLNCLSQHAMEGNLTLVGQIPPGLPEATYRPEIRIFGTIPGEPNTPFVSVWYQEPSLAVLPSIRVGDAAPARIPWTLFGDYPVDGHRGVQAQQDVGFYAMPTRVRYPSQLAVIPRLDERSGAPLVYRLEPGSQWLSGTDRRFPCPPFIRLAYPSGELMVEIIQPDHNVVTIGPAPIRQSSVRTPTVPGGTGLAEGTGQIADLYHLATMDDDFAYSFEQYGLHTIQILGMIQDIYGNTYNLDSTYEVYVAQPLDLDPAQLPSTPYEQGDFFATGLHVYPPVPAFVDVHLTHMPFSDPAQAVHHWVSGQANRFGYFQPPPGDGLELSLPGEFRVDITAEYMSPDGTLWMGAMTWGNVVEGVGTQIEAHGRRGMDYKSDTIDDMPAWFENANLPPSKVGIENYYPYFSGDIHWGDEVPENSNAGNSIHSIITIRDLTASKAFYGILRDHFPRARNCFRWPPTGCDAPGLEKRFAIGEAPLFITTQSGRDPAIRPEDIDLWGYWYGSSERPDVHVREIISEDGMGTAYWRFNDTYGYQIGEPADGDQPGDIKWEFGGAVLRVPSQSIQEYAIYSSLWALLPQDDPVGARVTPPFQDATGASINGGPILELLGEEIDMLFLPKGIRPGDVLEVGDTISFSGHVGPPLDSRVELTITSPTGVARSRTWHANKIGWLYDPSFDFVANEPGRWTVDVYVEHDRPYIGNNATPLSHNTGTVMGTTGQYSFYVVEPGSPKLPIVAPQPGFLDWPSGHIEPLVIEGIAPPGTTSVHFTIFDKGIVMGQGSLTPGPVGAFQFVYDPVSLHADFSMLSLTAREGIWEGLSDEVSIHLLAEGSDPLATTVTLIGEQVFVETIPWYRLYLPSIRNQGF